MKVFYILVVYFLYLNLVKCQISFEGVKKLINYNDNVEHNNKNKILDYRNSDYNVNNYSRCNSQIDYLLKEIIKKEIWAIQSET